jgi:hypothetical protein
MAAEMGKDGSIAIGANVIGLIDSWSLTASIGNSEITQYGDPMRNYQTTIKEWSGQASGTLSLADAQQISLLANATTAANTTAAAVALQFVTAVGHWGGYAYVKGYTANSKVTDKVSISFPFQGTGNLAYTSS